MATQMLPFLPQASLAAMQPQMDVSVASVPGQQYDVVLPPLETPEGVMSREEATRVYGGQVRDWGHKFLETDAAYGKTRGEGACIFVLDTGGSYSNDDLTESGRYLPNFAKNFTDAKTMDDMHGHSTHCAGIAAASNNDAFVIGVAPGARLVPVKVLNDSGSGQYAWIASAIRYVADVEGLPVAPDGTPLKRIISMSLGGGSADKGVTDAIDYAISKGVFIVVAAGNSGYRAGKDTVNFPGNYTPVVTVASLDQGGTVSSFSSAGPAVDIAAPGGKVLSTLPKNQVGTMSGTSMATPHVAGVVALLVSAYGFTHQDQLAKFLEEKAKDMGDAGKDQRTGAGAPIVSGYFAAGAATLAG